MVNKSGEKLKNNYHFYFYPSLERKKPFETKIRVQFAKATIDHLENRLEKVILNLLPFIFTISIFILVIF